MYRSEPRPDFKKLTGTFLSGLSPLSTIDYFKTSGGSISLVSWHPKRRTRERSLPPKEPAQRRSGTLILLFRKSQRPKVCQHWPMNYQDGKRTFAFNHPLQLTNEPQSISIIGVLMLPIMDLSMVSPVTSCIKSQKYINTIILNSAAHALKLRLGATIGFTGFTGVVETAMTLELNLFDDQCQKAKHADHDRPVGFAPLEDERL